MKDVKYKIILEPMAEGGYLVKVPALPGCLTHGTTYENAVAMARDAIEGYLYSLAKEGEPIPEESEQLVETQLIVKTPAIA